MRNCRVVNELVSILINKVERTTRNKQFCRSQKFFSLSFFIMSLVVVKEKIIKRNTCEWQEQRSCNRRTIIVLHIWKRIMSVLLWQDRCVIVCCTTRRIGLKNFFLFSLNETKLSTNPASKLSNVNICFI